MRKRELRAAGAPLDDCVDAAARQLQPAEAVRLDAPLHWLVRTDLHAEECWEGMAAM